MDIDFHRETAASYDASVTREHAVYHDRFLASWLGRVAGSGSLAVDFGCGTGVVSVALAEHGFRVIGIDHSPEMLAVARTKLAARGLEERVELRHRNVLDPGIEAASADVVTCQGVLHHLDGLDPCVEAMARVLRPGGRFYVSEPCADPAPPGRLVRGAVRLAVALRRLLRRRSRAPAPESAEAPIRWPELAAALDRHGLSYEAEFITHVPLIHGFVPDRARLAFELAVSRPWRHSRGDIVFVTGTKPGA